MTRSTRSARSDERGSAPAEFVMVAALVVFLFLGLVQLGYALHVRNTLLAEATEGARAGARAGGTEADAVARTRHLIRAELPDRYARQVVARTVTVDGVQVTEVTVTAPLPVAGPLGPDGAVTVHARSVREGQ